MKSSNLIIGVSNQLISLASRESTPFEKEYAKYSHRVSNQLISLASREVQSGFHQTKPTSGFQSINFPSE
jgi:hypothetical protein